MTRDREWRWTLAGFVLRGLWWLMRLPFRLLWVLLHLAVAGLLRAAQLAPRGLTPRGRLRQAERRIAIFVLTPATGGTWFAIDQLADRLGIPDHYFGLPSLAVALVLVISSALIAWNLWRHSPAGLRWSLTRELENPRRVGFRRPRGSVKGVTLR
jgi:hypothetical protein